MSSPPVHLAPSAPPAPAATSPSPSPGKPHPGWAQRLGRDISAAAVVSLAALSFYVSAASLLFQGPLAAHLPLAIGATLLGSAVLGLFAAARGALPLASVGAEPATVPVMAALTAATAAAAGPSAALPSALAALAVAGLLVGLTWWVLGRRGAGDLIRYIPYPVIGGFLASIGYLMATGGLGVAMGQAFTPVTAWAWLTGTADVRLAVALGLGLLIWWTTLRSRHVLTLPVLIVGGALLVHGGLWLAGLDVAQARSRGWLLAPFAQTWPQGPGTPGLLAAVDWAAVTAQAGLMVSVVIVATIGLLLSDTSLEVAWDTRADLNRDLRVLGAGNLAASALGGVVGGVSISRSILNRHAGAAGRGSGVALAAICLAAIAWGGPVVALVPRPLLGAILVYLGIGMLKTWLLDSRARLARADHATVLLMVGITAVAGFLPAVFVGVLACCLDFAFAAARQAPVRRRLTRRAWPSRAERSAAQQALLQAEGQGLLIVELYGLLFFGSATRLTRELEPVLAGTDRPRRLLLDLTHVRWLDSSAAQALGRLMKQAQGLGVAVHLSRVSAPLARVLRGAGAMPATTGVLHDDIDAAVDAWDEEVLARADTADPGLAAQLAAELGDADAAARVLAHFDTVVLADGQALFGQGDPSDALYLLQSGRLTAWVQTDRGDVPVRRILPGGAVGEMGLFRAVPRSASLRADGQAVVLRLRADGLDALQRAEPALAAALYRVFLRQLAGRLDQATTQAHALAH